MAGPFPFYTIGHSTLAASDFARHLQSAGVALLADVRSIPRSRTNPQFNSDVLPQSLAANHIAYRHFPQLGGRRPKSKTIPPEVNRFWTHQAFHNYADYAWSEAFEQGLAALREWATQAPCAMMCSESVWWRCHRRILADYLLAGGEQVYHIVGSRVERAQLTDGARPSPGGAVRYPAPPDLLQVEHHHRLSG